MAIKGGRISTGTTAAGGEVFKVDVQIEGIARSSEEFKRIRGSINAQLRDAMQRVGESTVLPAIKRDFPVQGWAASGAQSGLPSGAMAASLFVKRDRGGVFIGSQLRGSLNRALGWIDFGGRRANDQGRRTGPHVIVRALDEHRPDIDRAIVGELKQAFRNFEQSWS